MQKFGRINMPEIRYNTWVCSIRELIKEDPNIVMMTNSYIQDNICRRIVIAVDTRTHEYGIAFCHPDDQFDLRVGQVIAYCKLKKLDIKAPPKIVPIGTLKNGDECIYGTQKIQIVGESPHNKNVMVYGYLSKSIGTYLYAEVNKDVKVCVED